MFIHMSMHMTNNNNLLFQIILLEGIEHYILLSVHWFELVCMLVKVFQTIRHRNNVNIFRVNKKFYFQTLHRGAAG